MSGTTPNPLRLLLVSANQERFPEPVFPLGTLFVAQTAQREGVEVRLFDASLFRSSQRALKATIHEFKPDWVGVSLRNIDNSGYPFTPFYLPHYQKLISAIREVTRAPVILGGPAFSMFPKEFMTELRAEIGVTGDGEAGIVAALKGARGLVDLHLAHLDHVGVPHNLQTLFPAFKKYRTLGVQTARGCPHHCIYCSYPTIEGRKLRCRPPEAVAEELEFLTGLGKREFFIVDSSFNADETHMARVLETILKRRLAIRFTCYLEPRMSDPGLFELLARAGCEAIDFGTDSGSELMLRNLKKGFTPHDVLVASECCRKLQMDFCHSLTFGGPGETLETIRETAELMRACRPTAVIPMTALRIYPQTELAERALLEGRLEPGDTLFEPRHYLGDWKGPDLLQAVRDASRGASHWFFPAAREWNAFWPYRLICMFQQKRPMWRNLMDREMPKFVRWVLE